MGTKKLLEEDIWVPIDLKGVEEYQNFKWEEVKVIIFANFNDYDPEFGSIAKKMFDENHVDASPRKGKPGVIFWENFQVNNKFESWKKLRKTSQNPLLVAFTQWLLI